MKEKGQSRKDGRTPHPNGRKLIAFRDLPSMESFYAQLPEVAKKRVKVFPRCCTLSLQDEDVATCQERLPRGKARIEENLTIKLHSCSGEKLPWGVAFVQAPSFWRVSQGNGVKVGVIDTGIDGSHPELRRLLAEGVNTVDATSPFRDDNGHGTHVSGTIGARRNGRGLVGIAPNVRLYSIKCFNSKGEATVQDLLEGIEWAVEKGLDVLNMSFGLSQYSEALWRGVRAAARANIVLVASAGNGGGGLEYPAKFDEVLAVGAIDKEGNVPDFSSRGKGLDFVCPGVEILSTWPHGGYKILSGTSLACAHLTGVAALLRSCSGRLSTAQVRQLLQRTARPLPGMSRETQGYGPPRLREVLPWLRSLAERKLSG